MTGYMADTGPVPLSVLSILSIADLGYTVDASQADPYNVTQEVIDSLHFGSLQSSLVISEQNKFIRGRRKQKRSYGNDILNLPLSKFESTPKGQ